MPRALRVCPAKDCVELTPGGRCAKHRQVSDRSRGTRQERGYGREHERRFRNGVLRRDPLCRCDRPGEHEHGPVCLRPSSRADHWPRDKRELRRLGLDEHDPAFGRGLCETCDSSQTASRQPGGWHQRR